MKPPNKNPAEPSPAPIPELVAAPTIETAKVCRCGHGKHHHMVSGQGEYTATGWFWVLFGVTTKPIKVKFKCRVCNQIFHESNDPEVLQQHT